MTKRPDDHRLLAWGRSFAERLGLRADHRRRVPRGPQVAEWRPAMRRRLLVGAAVFGMWSLGIEARLVYLQVLSHDDLVDRAERQQNRSIEAHPKRGEILDRGGRVLAYSVDADTIYAVPTDIDDPAATAEALCQALDHCDVALQQTIEKRLGRDRAFAYVQRQVSPAVSRRVSALQLDGIGFLSENRRYYPNKELAAHVLGYVGIDNQGLSGIESTYDREISGRPGKILIQTDARRQAFSRVAEPPTAGAAIELTIDKFLQHIAERELNEALRQHRADSGSVVILEPYSGELLALASAPSFNPNTFADAPAASLRNRAVQDAYEPGSTFKIVTSSAALEEGVVTSDELFDVSSGVIRVGARTVRDFTTHGVLSFEDVIAKSSNVGAIKVGLRLGPERLSRYVRRFGFGEALSPDFPGESPGIVNRPASLGEQDVVSISMGYAVSVTPLQMAAAAGAVANGGELVEPRVVRAVLRNGSRTERPRRVIRRSVTEATAAELTGFMEAVVERGTAKQAQIPGYTVAGKTGTAEKSVAGRYSNVDHIASFVGFVPSRAPALTILVTIDTPRSGPYTGGAVAAPVFKRIAEAALRHLAVPPTIHPDPPVLVAAKPAPRVELASSEQRTPAVLGLTGPVVEHGGGMPDLRGLSARRAVEALGILGVDARLSGDGFVVDHEPGPGTPVDRGGSVRLTLERHRTYLAGGVQ